MSDAVSSVTSWVSDTASQASNTVSQAFSDVGLGGSLNNYVVPALALGAAAFTGGASLALDAGAVATADGVAMSTYGMTAAEAMDAGISAEALGLPAATTAADLGSVAGTASGEWAAGAGSPAGIGAGGAGTGIGSTAVDTGVVDGATGGIGAGGAGSGIGPAAGADQAAATAAGYTPAQIAQAAKSGITVAKLLQGAGTALGIIPAAKGLFSGGLTGGGATSATDPYAQYRPQAAQQLNTLMNNPAQAMSQPGYQQQLQQGMQQAQRGAAATGQLQSGAEMNALQQQGQNTFGSYYNTLVGNLMQMSGASQNPASGQVAAQQIAASKQNVQNQQLGTLTSGIGSIASLYNSSGGTSDPYANAQSAISQYGSSNVYGYGGGGVAGSAAGIDPNVLQF